MTLVSNTYSFNLKFGPNLKSIDLLFLMAILLNLNLFQFSNAFNLETRLAVIKYGPKHSYFGYSVAEHLILDETSKQITEAV